MDDRVRASNADRDRAAALLRDHFVAGRLTHAELNDRLTAALAAVTFGDLRRALVGLTGPGSALTDDSRLERSYRRLLALYPARYRRVHEEEILAVLMTAAAQGQHRPGLAEAADLIIGALRVRCQTLRGGVPGWRIALALIGAGTVLGLLAGILFASASPPPYVASATVRLAAPRSVNQHAEHVIASAPTTFSMNRLPSPTSYPVLAHAVRMLSTRCVLRPRRPWRCRPVVEPHLSVQALQSRIQISLLPHHEIVINTEATDGSSARRVRNIVAGSWVFYVWQQERPRWFREHPPEMLYVVPAAPPRARPAHVLETSVLGALFGALFGALICAGIGAAALIPRRRLLRIT
jgi:hypothetical protein